MGISHKALFDKHRDAEYLNRIQKYAKWTLPQLAVDLYVSATSSKVPVQHDFQEIGALLVNNLAAKLAQILFPTQYPFFQATASTEILEMYKARGVPEDGVTSIMARLGITASQRIFSNSGYANLILGLKYLIVTGQTLLYRDSKNARTLAYGPQSFSVRRDGKGKLMDCILREFTVVEALPEDLQASLRKVSSDRYSRPECKVEQYTRVHFMYKKGAPGYTVSQEIDTVHIGEDEWYPENLCPWIVPTWSLILGEHNGRGMVEDYAGGLAKLSEYSEASSLYAIEIMRVIHLVAQGAGDIDEIATAESGEWRVGNPESIRAYEAGDANKLSAITAEIDRTATRLAQAFMYQAAVRNAERVTAYELQQLAMEAENTLGGSVSSLTSSTLIPLAYLTMAEISEDIELGVALGGLKPNVTAGIPALGRAAEVQNLLLAANECLAILQLAQMDERVDSKRLVDLVFAGRSVDPAKVFYTAEQQQLNLEAKQAAEQAQASLVQAGTLAQQSEVLNNTLGGQQ